MPRDTNSEIRGNCIASPGLVPAESRLQFLLRERAAGQAPMVEHCITATNPFACSQRGMTLIELMTVILIVGLFLSLAAPSFTDGIQRNRRLSSVEEMAGLLTLARTEAVTRATPVSMCPTTDSSSCNGNNWETGVLIFEDDGSGAGTAMDRERGADEDLIRTYGGAGSGITIRSNDGFPAPDGILFGVMGGTVDIGTLKICDAKGISSASGLILNRSGQSRLATDDNGDGIINDEVGTSLSDCL